MLANKNIIKYCYECMGGINVEQLKAYNVTPVHFMEILYSKCHQNLLDTGNFHITGDDMKDIYACARIGEDVTIGFLDGRNILLSVDEDDNLIFGVPRQIAAYNEL